MRNQALDVLRGVAILMVLGFHYSYFHWWWQVGWTGVDLFFVLSGFLISGLLLDEFAATGGIGVWRFWTRRGFKIYPPYYVLMVVTAVGLFAARGTEPAGMWSELVFLQNYLPHIWQHTWSLAVEEHFYFMLPLLLAFLARKGRLGLLPWVFAALAVACLVMRVVEFANGVPAAVVHAQTHLRIDSLFAGVAIRYWKTSRPQSFQRVARLPLWLGGLLVAPAFFLPPAGEFMSTAGLTLLYCGFGCVLVWAVGRPKSNAPVAIALAWVGRSSYSIYLWHLPLWALLYGGAVTFRFFAEGVALSILLGWAMSKAVERPSLALREKLFPKATGPEPVRRPTVAVAGGN